MEFNQIAILIDNAEKAQHVANFRNAIECKILSLSEAHKTAEVSIELDAETEQVIFKRTLDGITSKEDVTRVIGQQLRFTHDILEAPKPERKRRTRKAK